MPATPARDSAPDPAHNPSSFLANALSALSESEGKAILAFLDFWRDLPRRRRAMLAMAAKPDLTDAQVGRLVGRSPRQLRRWDEYKRLKAKRDDLKGRGRYRGFSNPDDHDA